MLVITGLAALYRLYYTIFEILYLPLSIHPDSNFSIEIRFFYKLEL